MQVQLPFETVVSIMGIGDDIERLKTDQSSHHNIVHTDSDGTTRSVHLKLEKLDGGGLSISAEYLLHAGQNYNFRGKIFDISLKSDLAISEVRINGQLIGAAEHRKVYKIVRDLRDRIGERKEWTNFIKLCQIAQLEEPVFGSMDWPGLAPNGEIRALQAHKVKTESAPVFPALFLPGIIGCGPEAYSGQDAKNYSFHVHDSLTKGDIILEYQYKRGKTPSHITMCVSITSVNGESLLKSSLYELETCQDKKSPDHIKIKSLKIHHVNAPEGQLDRVDLKTQKSLATALKSIRMLNRMIRGGEIAIRDEHEKPAINRRLFMPSDIWALTGLNDVMTPNPIAPARGRLCFTPLGGQNTKRIFSDYDFHIGGNSYRLDYYLPKTKIAQSLIIDKGVLFHDAFDLSFTNQSRYMRHKYNKARVSDRHLRAILLTHRHKDHIAQIALDVKYGYDLPPIIMPPLAARQIKREMNELGIEQKVIKEIESKFVILDRMTIAADATEANPNKLKITGELIELYWEHLEGEKLNQVEKFPVVKIGDFKVRAGPMPHSDPGFMYEIITPAGSHLHTGDFKMDPTIALYQPSFKIWLRHCKAASLSIDSTGATRDDYVRTPWEDEIQTSVAKLFMENADNRFVVPILGSNAARLTSLIAAMGMVGKKNLIIDGRALEHLYDDMNVIYGLKKWAQREHGVFIAKRGSREAKDVLANQSNHDYVIAVTGTQLEPTSSLNRALSAWLPNDRYEIGENDIIMPLQGPIPVGDNMSRRWAAKYFAEVFYGCRFILPEIIEKESDLKISGSGHASPMDIRELYSYLENLETVFPVHGGPEQLAAGAKIAQDYGLKAILAENFDNYEFDKNGAASKLKVEVGEMVGIKSHLPDENTFWLRRHFSTTVAAIPMQDRSLTGQAIANFERALYAAIGINKSKLMEEAARFHLSRTFNMSAVGGFLTGRYKFGIEKLKGSVWDEKLIGLIASFDTETTGTDDRFDFITQFSMTSYNLRRKRINQTELRQRLPEYTIPNPEALLVTATEPNKKNDRELHPVLFADQILTALNDAKAKAKDFAKQKHPDIFANNSSTRAKMLMIAHNLPFDDRQLRALFKDTLSPSTRPHASNGVIGLDTLHLARSIHAIYPDRLRVRKYLESDYLNFTLQGLCEENGISYDTSKAHSSALYDSERAMKLFWKMMDIAPDIVDQMIFNADSAKGHLLNDMTGYDTGIDGPHPVFCYLSRQRNLTDIRMGCIVGMLDSGSKAIIANLAYNPQDVLGLPAEAIANRLADKKDDCLEIIDLRQSPMVLPAKYFYTQNKSKEFPREMFDRRARIVREYLNYRDIDLGMTNIHERLLKAWEDKKIPILWKYGIIEELQPDLKAPLNEHLKNAQKNISVMRNNATMRSSRISFYPPAQETSKKIKAYREKLIEFLSQDGSVFDCAQDVNNAYFEVMCSSPSEGQKFIISNIHYDIDPKIMSVEQLQAIRQHRAFHTKHTLERAQAIMKKLADDPKRYESLVGRSLKKMKIYRQLVNSTAQLSQAKIYDADAARRAIMPWKRTA